MTDKIEAVLLDRLRQDGFDEASIVVQQIGIKAGNHTFRVEITKQIWASPTLYYAHIYTEEWVELQREYSLTETVLVRRIWCPEPNEHQPYQGFEFPEWAVAHVLDRLAELIDKKPFA